MNGRAFLPGDPYTQTTLIRLFSRLGKPLVDPQLETPVSSLTPEQENVRLRDILSWVADNVRCVQTRKFIARGLRELDAAKKGQPLKERPPEREKRPT